eukprot:1008301-Pelagomonas_calceolata.AAC.4
MLRGSIQSKPVSTCKTASAAAAHNCDWRSTPSTHVDLGAPSAVPSTPHSADESTTLALCCLTDDESRTNEDSSPTKQHILLGRSQRIQNKIAYSARQSCAVKCKPDTLETALAICAPTAQSLDHADSPQLGSPLGCLPLCLELRVVCMLAQLLRVHKAAHRQRPRSDTLLLRRLHVTLPGAAGRLNACSASSRAHTNSLDGGQDQTSDTAAVDTPEFPIAYDLCIFTFCPALVLLPCTEIMPPTHARAFIWAVLLASVHSDARIQSHSFFVALKCTALRLWRYDGTPLQY